MKVEKQKKEERRRTKTFGDVRSVALTTTMINRWETTEREGGQNEEDAKEEDEEG